MDKKLLMLLLGYLSKNQWKDAIKKDPKAKEIKKEVCRYYNSEE